MWRGRRKSGYGHTAVQQIIIGFVRRHLLCQHSSRQPGAAETSPAEFRAAQRHKYRKSNAALGLDNSESLNLQPSGSQVQISVCPATLSLTKTDSLRLTLTSDLPGFS